MGAGGAGAGVGMDYARARLGGEFVTRLRLRLAVVCGVVAAGGMLLVGSVASNADPVASGLSSIGPRGAAAEVASFTSSGGSEAGPAPAVGVVALSGASFGSKLVDGPGRTLYLFSLDPPGTSKCVGACAGVWLPARSIGGKPRPGAGVAAPNVGNIQRPDGSEQMTFNGHPLYYYSGDGGPGRSNGESRSEFGGRWSAQPPAKPGDR